MLFQTNNFSNIVVYNSITNDLNDQKYDSIQPFTFVQYLNYSKSLNKNIIQFSDYQTYLSNWNTKTNNTNDNLSSQVSNQFVAFLESITINFTTNEEKRFLTNINFYNTDDLEIALPFYVNKIKQVLLYYAQKRDTYKIDLQLAKNNGTIAGIEKFLQTYIVETILGQDNPPFTNLATPLSAISNQIQIEVEEGYDTFNDYFDLDPFQPPSFYEATGERAVYFQANTNLNDNNLFLDYNQAIINLINSEKVALQALQNLVININTPDPTLLQPYDFIDYNTVSSNNILLSFNKQLVQNYSGTDMYYLSTNALGQVLSGNMFMATEPYLNLLNVYNPSTLTVPSTSTKYERDVGLFFKPSTRSLIQVQTPFDYYVNPNLPTDTTYTFPDPSSYGNISGVSKEEHTTPLNFVLQGELIQKNISSNNALGNTNISENDFTFESYHSLEQQQSTVNYIQPFYNSGVVYQYISDLYGNTIIGLKQLSGNYINNFAGNIKLNSVEVGLPENTDTLYLSSIQDLIVNGTFYNTQSNVLAANIVNNQTLYDLRNCAGNFYVFNIATTQLSPLSTSFLNIINKYNTTVQNDLTGNLFSVEVFKDTFVFTTSSYVVVDRVVFDNGQFYKSPNIPLILPRSKNNTVTNPFLIDNNIYLFNYYLDVTSNNVNGNARPFILDIYSYDITNNTFTTNISSNNLSFNYGSNVKLDSYTAVMSYNSKFDIFNIAINMKDGNKNFYMHNIQCRYNSNQLNIVNNKFFQPTNSNYTVNFYDYSNAQNILKNALVTTPTILPQYGSITF